MQRKSIQISSMWNDDKCVGFLLPETIMMEIPITILVYRIGLMNQYEYMILSI